MSIPNISAIDLFCGAGGLTRGLENSGINVLLGVDSDPQCEYPYSKNNKSDFILKSVEDLSGAELLNYYNQHPKQLKLLAGCAPCQTFSHYNQKANSEDKRWWLLSHFGRLIQETQPDFITMENVPLLKNKDVYADFISILEKEQYFIDSKFIVCSDYNLPQSRKRLVLIASKLGPIELLKPKQKRQKTVRDALGKLPEINAGDMHVKDRLHQASVLSPINMQRIKASTPGGSWLDWDEELISTCHKKKTGKSFYNVYGRMEWDKPSPTITTQFYVFGTGRFGHPEQDRALSLREGAILQGFPKSYKFFPKNREISKKVAGRLIGNAVPVKLAEIIGKSFLKHVNDIYSKN